MKFFAWRPDVGPSHRPEDLFELIQRCRVVGRDQDPVGGELNANVTALAWARPGLSRQLRRTLRLREALQQRLAVRFPAARLLRAPRHSVGWRCAVRGGRVGRPGPDCPGACPTGGASCVSSTCLPTDEMERSVGRHIDRIIVVHRHLVACGRRLPAWLRPLASWSASWPWPAAWPTARWRRYSGDGRLIGRDLRAARRCRAPSRTAPSADLVGSAPQSLGHLHGRDGVVAGHAE